LYISKTYSGEISYVYEVDFTPPLFLDLSALLLQIIPHKRKLSVSKKNFELLHLQFKISRKFFDHGMPHFHKLLKRHFFWESGFWIFIRPEALSILLICFSAFSLNQYLFRTLFLILMRWRNLVWGDFLQTLNRFKRWMDFFHSFQQWRN